jgi:hypothetical protein
MRCPKRALERISVCPSQISPPVSTRRQCIHSPSIMQQLFIHHLALNTTCFDHRCCVKTPHAARENSNAEARGILQIADIAKQRANEQKNKLLKRIFRNNHIALNKWTTPRTRWNRILQKYFNRKFYLFICVISKWTATRGFSAHQSSVTVRLQ